jgi:hypothetical protein
VKAFDNSSGKWPLATPEVATSLLVSLSAQLLKWQNPAEGCGDLLQVIAVNFGGLARRFFARGARLTGLFSIFLIAPQHNDRAFRFNTTIQGINVIIQRNDSAQ